jgi:spore coat polysaccharide biosynthesis protein SpsF
MISNKKIGLIIPTRYKSERLPGKVLIDINGKPNLQRIIERVSNSKYIDNIILAVSEDDKIELDKWFYNSKFLGKHKIGYVHGSHNNIFYRTLESARRFELDIICDISHCCSFVDPVLIDILIQRLIQYEVDYSSNCITRSFPDGLDCQVYTREIYEIVFDKSVNWKPYWTGWNIFHTREDLWPKPRIINYEASLDYFYPEWRLTLDTPEDLKIIRQIYKHFENFKDMESKEPCYMDIINYIESDLDLLKAIRNNQTIPTKLEKENI